MTASLRSSTVLTARFLHLSIPYGYNGLGPNLNADPKVSMTPGHRDAFTGVSRINYTAGPSPAYQPRRDDVNVKLNHFVSGSRVDHDIRFRVQIARNLDGGQQFGRAGSCIWTSRVPPTRRSISLRSCTPRNPGHRACGLRMN